MTPWILLRGLTRETRHWGDFSERLQSDGTPVLALDLPGNGRLCHEPSPTRVEAMAEHARAQLQQLKLAPPYRLLAMSLGLSRIFSSDIEQLQAGMLVYDSLYRWARDATEETHNWPAAGGKAPK